MNTSCGIINPVKDVGRFYLSSYISLPERPTSLTRHWANWWADLFGDNMIPKTSGIYEIRNKINGKVYIGSAIRFSERKSRHWAMLRGGYHYNKHLQSAWNKYGEDSFEFNVLLLCDRSSLTSYENMFLTDVLINKYNIALDATSPNLGKKLSPNDCKKKSITGRGHGRFNTSDILNIRRLYYIDNIGQEEIAQRYNTTRPNIGYIVNGKTYGYIPWEFNLDEAKQRKQLHLGKLFSTLHRGNSYNKGHKWSDERRHQASKAMSGENNPSAKLQLMDVIELRNLFSSGRFTQQELADRFNISREQAHKIITYQSFKEDTIG